MTYDFAWFLATIIGILVIALPLMLAVAMIIYADRKIWAAIALRRGPNVVGPWGLLQSFADGLKVFLKETIIPSSANKGLFKTQGLPAALGADAFSPTAMPRAIPGRTGTQHFFSSGGRAFCLYVVLGSHTERAALLPLVNTVVGTITIDR